MRGLPKCYLLHTDPSKFRELGKTCQATCFPLSTLNHWSFTEHTSWPSKPRLPKFRRLMSLDHKPKMRCCAMSSNYGPWWDYVAMSFGSWASASFLWIWTLLGFKIDSPKIHDSVGMVRVANEMKPCGGKICPQQTTSSNLVQITLKKFPIFFYSSFIFFL